MTTFETTKPLNDLGADKDFWRSVAVGEGGTDWAGRLPDDIRSESLGKLDEQMAAGHKFQDISVEVSLADDDTLRVRASARPVSG